ncbi:hypothetical protein Prudu_015998 [Prunus dulcis]|uniref:Uncharacterized protein n=1 Tax=Prunus dulcis TaxID=3755 RepID=A0A4Y1RM70_PRUDU|nr:hypothetical protein Prudu_015998 [Prunus dulcis]
MNCSFPPSVTMTQHQQPHLLSSQGFEIELGLRVNQSILGRQSGQASHIVLSCAGNFVSSGLKAKTRVDLEKRRAEKERAEKGHVPSGYFLPLTFKVFQLAAYPPFPASDMGWGKELGQVQD